MICREGGDTNLVVPAIRACSDLNATLEVIRATEEVVAEICEIVRRRLVIETNYEEGIVDNI